MYLHMRQWTHWNQLRTFTTLRRKLRNMHWFNDLHGMRGWKSTEKWWLRGSGHWLRIWLLPRHAARHIHLRCLFSKQLRQLFGRTKHLLVLSTRLLAENVSRQYRLPFCYGMWDWFLWQSECATTCLRGLRSKLRYLFIFDNLHAMFWWLRSLQWW